MMSLFILVAGLVLAGLVLFAAVRLPGMPLKRFAAVIALLVMGIGLVLSSFRYISADEVGIVVKNVGTKSLAGGAYIAVNGEQGIQADVLPPGWHFGYWPFIFDVREVPLIEVKSGEVGLIETTDGKPLDPGQIFAPEYAPDELGRMLDARYFLTTGNGRKGAQSNVLTTGKYRLNTALFRVKMVPVTEVVQGEVAVLKANFGKAPTVTIEGVATAAEAGSTGANVAAKDLLRLAGPEEMGIRADPLPPGKYPLNTDAYTVVDLWTTQMIAHYTAISAGNPISKTPGGRSTPDPESEEREIIVRTSDGFTFPVDVRVAYVIEPRNAPIVVAKLGDDEGDRFRDQLNSAVRAIFRNNAEKVKALDYVQQRSHQEEQSAHMIADEMIRYGVTVTDVRIGNVGDEETLGTLLKTQTDREIAKQELLTFQEQMKTAEEQQKLNKAKQSAEEERKLATAAYSAKIAEEAAKQKITEATAEAESITIRAKAQADAYQLIALQIGKSNAAMIELLKIAGEKGIQIAPRVMVLGNGSSGSGQPGGTDGASAALIGTLLDMMVNRAEDEPATTPATVAKE